MAKPSDQNPYLQYGVAIENFFNLEVALIKIFCILSVLAIPQMIVFASYGANMFYQTSNWMNAINFGNLGQANSVCSKAPNTKQSKGIQFVFTCSEGYSLQ